MAKYVIQTTNHKAGIYEQFNKIREEFEELFCEIKKADNMELLIDEAIDVSKAALKLAEIACTNIKPSLDDMIKRNNEKNETRNYHN